MSLLSCSLSSIIDVCTNRGGRIRPVVERSVLGSGWWGGNQGGCWGRGRGFGELCETADWELHPGQAWLGREFPLLMLFSFNQEISA